MMLELSQLAEIAGITWQNMDEMHLPPGQEGAVRWVRTGTSDRSKHELLELTVAPHCN